MRLTGTAAVVTGAARGLGRAAAIALAGEGAKVVLFDRIEDEGRAVAAEIARRGGEAVFFHGDVTREEQVVGAIDACQASFGSFDTMVNNAGISFDVELHETTNAQWEAVNDVNLRGVFWGCKHAVIAMRRAGTGGSIINTGSIVSLAGFWNLPAYAATKHGILGLTKCVAVGYAADGIRCNCVCPGDMDTPMIRHTMSLTSDPAAAWRDMERCYPVGRIAQPEEIANAFVFLASRESSFMTGASLLLDGGLLARAY